MTSKRFEQAAGRLAELAEENAGRMLRNTRSVHRGIIEVSDGSERVITSRFCCVTGRLAIRDTGITLSQSFPESPGRWTTPKVLGDSERHAILLEGWADDIETADLVTAQ